MVSLAIKLEYIDGSYLPFYGNLQGYLRFVIPLESILPKLNNGKSQSDFILFLTDSDDNILLSSSSRAGVQDKFMALNFPSHSVLTQSLWGGRLFLRLMVPEAFIRKSKCELSVFTRFVRSKRIRQRCNCIRTWKRNLH